MMFDSGGPLLTRSPTGPVRSAIIYGSVPTLLQMDADIRLASVGGSSNSPTPVERRASLAGEGSKSGDSPGTSPEKMTVPTPLLEK